MFPEATALCFSSERASLSFPSYKEGTSRLIYHIEHLLYPEQTLSIGYPQLTGGSISHGETES